MRRYLLILLGSIFITLHYGCEKEFTAIQAVDHEPDITVLYTNDEHGWMEMSDYSDGCAAMMGLWREHEGYSEYGPFLILSGGDNWTGPAISTWFKGESMVDAMNAMGYDATAIGNHEFDFKIEFLEQRIAQADFPFLAANIREKATGESPDFAQSYIIKEVNNIMIGIIGLSSISTPWTTFPAHVEDLDFIPYKTALEQVVPQVRAAGAELLIVIGHICLHELRALAFTAQTLNISVMTGGHCNELFSEVYDDVVLIEGGSHMNSYAKVEISFDTEKNEITAITHGTYLNEGGSADTDVEQVVSFWQSEKDAALSQVIGFAAHEINRYSAEMHNMVTDSWLYSLPSADVSITNKGGIRQSVPPGDITLATIVGVLPFENTILELELTGTQLVDCMTGGLVVGGMTTIGGYKHPDGTPIVGDSLYCVLTTDYLFSRDDYHFSRYDSSPYSTSLHYRQPVIDWIESLNTSSLNPVNNYIDGTPRQY